jgi:hypothetical protein
MAPGAAGNLGGVSCMASILIVVIAVIFIIYAIQYGYLLSGMVNETLQYASADAESHGDDRPGSQSDKPDVADDRDR